MIKLMVIYKFDSLFLPKGSLLGLLQASDLPMVWLCLTVMHLKSRPPLAVISGY